MGFIQIIEYRTSRTDEMEKMMDRWLDQTEGKRTARKGFVARDRKEPNHYFDIVYFDSYELAMQNSQLPGTQEAAQKWMELCDEPPTFYDLDVVRTWEG